MSEPKRTTCPHCGAIGNDTLLLTYFLCNSESDMEGFRQSPQCVMKERDLLQQKLRRYIFEEKEYEKEESKKKFYKEILEHDPFELPMGEEKWEQYNLALELVGERHDKYELVALVNWLLIKANIK